MKKVNFYLFLTFLAITIGSCLEAASSSSAHAGMNFNALGNDLTPHSAQNTHPHEVASTRLLVQGALSRKPVGVQDMIARFSLTESMKTCSLHSHACLYALFITNESFLPIMVNIEQQSTAAYNTYRSLVQDPHPPSDSFIVKAFLVNCNHNNTYVISSTYPLQDPTNAHEYRTMQKHEQHGSWEFRTTALNIGLQPNANQFVVLHYSNNKTKIEFCRGDKEILKGLTDNQCELIRKLFFNKNRTNELTSEEFDVFCSLPLRMSECLGKNYKLLYRFMQVTTSHDNDFLNHDLCKKWYLNRDSATQNLNDEELTTLCSWDHGIRGAFDRSIYKFTYKGLPIIPSTITNDRYNLLMNNPLLQRLFEHGTHKPYALARNDFNEFYALPDWARNQIAEVYQITLQGKKITPDAIDHGTLNRLYYKQPHMLLCGAALVVVAIFGLYKLGPTLRTPATIAHSAKTDNHVIIDKSDWQISKILSLGMAPYAGILIDRLVLGNKKIYYGTIGGIAASCLLYSLIYRKY